MRAPIKNTAKSTSILLVVRRLMVTMCESSPLPMLHRKPFAEPARTTRRAREGTLTANMSHDLTQRQPTARSGVDFCAASRDLRFRLGTAQCTLGRMKTLGIGMVGARYGARLHLGNYTSLGEGLVELRGVCARTRASAESF